MVNWQVTLIRTVQPFDVKMCLVVAETVQEALEQVELVEKEYYARSARYHHANYGGDYGEHQHVA